MRRSWANGSMSGTRVSGATARRALVARMALALLVVVGAMEAVWWPTAAGAQGTTCTGYAPSPLTITPNPVSPGATVTAAGVALPNAPVTLTLRKPDQSTSVLATGTATSTGAFSIQAVIPTDLPAGIYEIIATSPDCPAPFTVVVTVTPPPGGTPSTTTSTSTPAEVAGVTTTVVNASSTSVVPSVEEVGSEVLGASSTNTSAGSEGGLAFTGGEVRPFIVVAITVIAVGALLVGTSRRRRT